MRNQFRICGVLGTTTAALLGIAGSGLAQTPTLDLKPGLWEVTSVGTMTGAPPIQPQVARNCVTENQLRRGLNFDDRPNPSCQRTMVSTSSSLLVVHEECTGARHMVGDFRFTAIDRETMKGDIDVVMVNGADTTTMKRSLQGKWLSSDCGDVKPSG